MNKLACLNYVINSDDVGDSVKMAALADYINGFDTEEEKIAQIDGLIEMSKEAAGLTSILQWLGPAMKRFGMKVIPAGALGAPKTFRSVMGSDIVRMGNSATALAKKRVIAAEIAATQKANAIRASISKATTAAPAVKAPPAVKTTGPVGTPPGVVYSPSGTPVNMGGSRSGIPIPTRTAPAQPTTPVSLTAADITSDAAAVTPAVDVAAGAATGRPNLMSRFYGWGKNHPGGATALIGTGALGASMGGGYLYGGMRQNDAYREGYGSAAAQMGPMIAATQGPRGALGMNLNNQA